LFDARVHKMVSCILRGRECTTGDTLLNHHGDYQCANEQGGTQCFGHEYEGLSKRIYDPLTISGQLNDVRPVQSPSMGYYYQIALRVSSDKGIESHDKAVSVLDVNNPYSYSLLTGQLLTTFAIPIVSDSFLFFSKSMAFSGHLVGVQWHAHALAMQYSLLLAGSAQQIGLQAHEQDYPWLSTLTSTTPYMNNTNLNAVLISRFAGRKECPFVVCHVQGVSEAVNNVFYDRAAHVQCSSWRFAFRDVFTVVAMHRPPLNSAVAFTGMSTSGTFFEHANPFLEFLSDDGLSHYVTAGGDGVAVQPIANRDDSLRAILHGGTPAKSMTLVEGMLISMMVATIWLLDALVGSQAPPALPLVLLGIPFAIATVVMSMKNSVQVCVIVTVAQFLLLLLVINMAVPCGFLSNPTDAKILEEQTTLCRPMYTARIAPVLLAIALLVLLFNCAPIRRHADHRMLVRDDLL